MKITKAHGDKNFEIEIERSGGIVIFRCNGKSHTWTPHPKIGRTAEELQAEMHAAAAEFAKELAGHHETNSLLDELFNVGDK